MMPMLNGRRAVTYDGPGAQAICSWYQGMLRLRDWSVAVEISTKAQMRTGVQAQIDWNLLRKTAVIRLLRASDYRRMYEPKLGPQDMELDIVHELCHLHLAPLDVKPDTPEDVAQEQAIEALSAAYVSLVRAKRKVA